MKRYKISFEISVPDHITSGMVASKFDRLEEEFYEHLDSELSSEETISVDNFSFWTTK